MNASTSVHHSSVQSIIGHAKTISTKGCCHDLFLGNRQFLPHKREDATTMHSVAFNCTLTESATRMAVAEQTHVSMQLHLIVKPNQVGFSL